MIRISDIKMKLNYTKQDIISACEKTLKLSADKIEDVYLIKKGIDARKKSDVCFSLTVDVSIRGNENNIISKCKSQKITISNIPKYQLPGKYKKELRPVIIGSGPAGLFAGYILSLCDAKPIIIERGCDVDKRKKIADEFRIFGKLNEECNIQFGEGGAGTFSDGKLNTGIKDPRIRKVLSVFCENGAPEEIMYSAKPHVGTDKLAPTIKNIRIKIIENGGQFLFESKLTRIKIKNDKVEGIFYKSNGKEIFLECHDLILAIGHSARDTFEMLLKCGVPMSQKPFSIGARIEHLRSDIDKSQYGEFAGSEYLGAADYKLSTHLKNGRGVYTFCMCPGGYVMPAASEFNSIATNGMSEYARDAKNSNSAVLTSVMPEDFGSEDILAGMYLQRKIEKDAFILGGENYFAPVTLVGDFIKGKSSQSIGDIEPSYKPGYKLCDIRKCLPSYVADSMAEGIVDFGRKIKGFDRVDAVLTAPETRSSSPVRILRGEDMQSIKIKGLYPCGEGAGYAGGITSAAVDGIKCAEMILK